jgi:predicted ribosome-associated RNA-binding protein Tma20
METVAPAPAKPAASTLKQLPLNASFKKAMMLDGNALALENTSTSSLSLTVRFSNRSGSKEFQVKLDPGAVKEMGWLGAWVLAPGDKVEIESPGYESIVKTAP